MKIGIASDHVGYALKQEIIGELNGTVLDFGCNSEESVDYPDYAYKLCNAMMNGNITPTGI